MTDPLPALQRLAASQSDTEAGHAALAAIAEIERLRAADREFAEGIINSMCGCCLGLVIAVVGLWLLPIVVAAFAAWEK